MDTDWKHRLGWHADFDAAMVPYAAKGLAPARVALVYRKQLKVFAESGERWARTGGSVMHRAESYDQLPAVGDWVAARFPQGDGGGEALVQAVLPRRSAFVRKVAGHHAAPHVLAANLDTVLVVMGLDGDFNVRRLERFLTLAWESKATPVVVLNKADLCPDVEAKLAEARAISRGAAIHAISAKASTNLDPIFAEIHQGKTVAFLGSSGVGKTTLINKLLGTELLTTGTVRDNGKGRHTTTTRELMPLPGGGSLIDTPGLREVQLWDSDGGLLKAFDDITTLGGQCRFSNCQHDAEPGCAVKGAVEAGTLDAARFRSWQELLRELERLQAPALERGRPETKRRARVGHGTRNR